MYRSFLHNYICNKPTTSVICKEHQKIKQQFCQANHILDKYNLRNIDRRIVSLVERELRQNYEFIFGMNTDGNHAKWLNYLKDISYGYCVLLHFLSFYAITNKKKWVGIVCSFFKSLLFTGPVMCWGYIMVGKKFSVQNFPPMKFTNNAILPLFSINTVGYPRWIPKPNT